MEMSACIEQQPCCEFLKNLFVTALCQSFPESLWCSGVGAHRDRLQCNYSALNGTVVITSDGYHSCIDMWFLLVTMSHGEETRERGCGLRGHQRPTPLDSPSGDRPHCRTGTAHPWECRSAPIGRRTQGTGREIASSYSKHCSDSIHCSLLSFLWANTD